MRRRCEPRRWSIRESEDIFAPIIRMGAIAVLWAIK